MERLLFF